MSRNTLKNYKKHSRWSEGIFRKNPILMLGLALPFAVMVTDSLKNAVSVSILLTCSLIPCVLLASLIGNRIPKWAAMPLYALLSLVLVCACIPMIRSIAPAATGSLGIYIPIISVNTLMFSLCDRYSTDQAHPGMALVDAVFYSVGFTFAMVLIACVREWAGNGSLWGYAMPYFYRIRGMQYVFSGFLVTGFFAALFQLCHRAFHIKLYRQQKPIKQQSHPSSRKDR